MKHSALCAAAVVLLSAAAPAHAITVAGFDPNSDIYLTTSVLSGGRYTGVAELMIMRSDLGPGVVEGCSGALLADGISVLTAAHCIAGGNGANQATSTSISFADSGITFTFPATGFFIHPAYDGTLGNPNDIAVLTLGSPAPAQIARYGLYDGDPSNQVIALAGFGFGGTGVSGYDALNDPFGTLRVALNQYDGFSAAGDLLFGFDDGTSAHDPLGSGYYLGPSEGFIAPGDSGGPSFINGQIAGVHSFIARIPNGHGGKGPDIDNRLNSSFGEYAGDVSVARNAWFLNSVVAPVPEPRTMFLVGMGLIAVALLGRRHNGA